MQTFPLLLRRSNLTPRLFQQACRASTSSRRGSKSPVKQQSRPSQLKKPPRPPPEDQGDGSIRWFEKDVNTGEVTRVAGNPEELEANEIRRKIKALEEELAAFESTDEHGFDRAMLEDLTPDERAKVERALAKRTEQTKELGKGLEISLQLPPTSVPILKRLNHCLREAALNINANSVRARKDLWIWYSRAKHSIPALPKMLPGKAWGVLWRTQSINSETNPQRHSHIIELLDDLVASGHNMTMAQKRDRTEALVLLGREDQAIAEWEDYYETTLGRDHHILEIGVRMFADLGDLDRAMIVLRESFENHPATQPNIILPLLSANLQAGNDNMAFALYTIMRAKLGPRMAMKDYDTVSLLFLAQNKKDLALAVFRDMMEHGKEAIGKHQLSKAEEHKLYYSTFQRLQTFGGMSQDATEMNNLNIKVLTSLPSKWQNKFFYGSWLKKLIGMDQIAAAARVVELMFERGIAPDSRHLNGLIAAMFRCDDAELQEKGERLGWSMIQQRQAFVQKRDGDSEEATEEGLAISDPPAEVSIPVDIARPMPKATLETFNVMVLHYLVQNKYAHIKHLADMLGPTKISMDAYFMDQLLYMHLYSEGPAEAWANFVHFSEHIRPDMETYNCLWTAQLRHLTESNPEEQRFSKPRELFLTMCSWYESLDPSAKAAAQEVLSREIQAKILQSFCTDKDLVGCLVAMHALYRVFGAAPNAEIARVVTVAVSNVPEKDAPHIRLRRGRQQMPALPSRTDNVAKVLEALRARRAAAALNHGVDIHKLKGERKDEENLGLLSELLRVVLVRSGMDVDQVEPMIMQASREMGVPDISTGDVDASNVS